MRKKTGEIRELDQLLQEIPKGQGPYDVTFLRGLNECWFSDTLAWLLDPKGSHKVGVGFARDFIRLIGERRSAVPSYKRRGAYLKLGKQGAGTGTAGFSLKNAAVVREFYLSKSIQKHGGRGPRYCDVVFMDLDAADGLFVTIENKLFGIDHPGQLATYYAVIEEKYQRLPVREYVYLSLTGAEPTNWDMPETASVRKNWIALSWIDDVLPLLSARDSKSSEYQGFVEMLNWLKALRDLGRQRQELVEAVRGQLLRAAAECLVEELGRLGAGGSQWSLDYGDSGLPSIYYSRWTKRRLRVALLPNYSVSVQGWRGNRGSFEKIIVPFGARADQIFNLLDLSARDIYHLVFSDTSSVLSRTRRLTATLSEAKALHKPLFDFLSRNHLAMKVLFMQSRAVQKAEELELEEAYGVTE